jgi:hypothetical protein
MRALGHEVVTLILGGTEKSAVEKYHDVIKDKSGWKMSLIAVLPKFLLNALKDIKLIRHDRNAAAWLSAAVREHKPDLVYERSEYMQDKGTMWCAANKIPHFLEINSPAVEEMRSFEGPSLLHWLGKRKEKNKIRHTTKIIVVSTSLKHYVESRYKPSAPVLVIPNGVNPEAIIADETARCHTPKTRMGKESGVRICRKYFPSPRGWEIG